MLASDASTFLTFDSALNGEEGSASQRKRTPETKLDSVYNAIIESMMTYCLKG